MKNIIITGVVLLSIISLTILKVKKPAPLVVAELPTKPWIVITNPEVFVLYPDGSVMKKLTNGESLDYPLTLSVSKEGKASVHFLDGSVLRLDSGTKVTLNEAVYDKDSGNISVKVSLALGKVWSKVIELTTPESVWEVRTSNAVATVRGTAFGMGTDGNKSRMLGSEHRVAVKPIDPKTGKEVGREAVILDEGKLLEWNNDDIELFKTDKKVIVAADIKASATVAGTSIDKDREWINENESEDKKVQADVDELKGKGLKTAEVRAEIVRKKHKEVERVGDKVEVQNSIEQKDKQNTDKRENKKNIEVQTPDIRKDKIEQIRQDEPVKNIIREDVKTAPVVRQISPINNAIDLKRAVPTELIIESDATLSKSIFEDAKTPFRAILIFSDGKRQNVTDSVEWKVLGPVGSINRLGVFISKLSAEISEVGEASGTITAVWREGDKELFAKTPIFKVEFNIGDDGDLRG
jgi:hypothetical protein